MENLLHNLKALLQKDERFVIEGELLKNKIVELALKLDKELIKLLLSDKKMKEVFFADVDKTLVFDKDKFIRFVSNKQFLPDSYTSFKNKIGLTVDDEYLSEKKEVVLSWPYKDCVLEGGMTKEDQKRNEIFWNEILAPDDISRLRDPKVFTNAKRSDKNGEHKFDKFKMDENDNIKDNIIIKGNNLLALHSLETRFAGQVKLIYIDPPYYFRDKKASDTFLYNTNFKLSTWITFMKNRLEVAKNLLKKEGAIFVQINDEGGAHLKVLMDEIFGKDNFLNTISVKAKNIAGASGGGEDKRLKKNIELLLCYCKDYNSFPSFSKVRKRTELMQFIQQMKEEDKSWKYTSVLIDSGKKISFKTIKDGYDNEIKIYKREGFKTKSINELAKEDGLDLEDVYNKYFDKIMTTAAAQSSIRTRVWKATDNKDNLYSIEYIPVSGRNKGKVTELFYKGKQKRLVTWLKDSAEKTKTSEMFKTEELGTLWDGINWNNIDKEGGVNLPGGKKPEELLKIIIEMASITGDLVLDFFSGSGTTCAVAHKMGRQYIGIEQLDYEGNKDVVRLKNVINGDQSGISESSKWKGGGDFVYLELLKWNENFVEKIQKAKTKQDLVKLWEVMKKKAFLSYKVNPDIVDEKAKDFADLSLENQKRFLVECLDKNHLYVNYSEINDKDYKVSQEDKELNKEFYKN